MSGIRATLWSAIGSSMLGRYGSYVASLVSLMVLARLFAPDHFGVIAAVQVAYTFGLILAESGFGPAIINQRSWSPRERDGVFTVTLLMGSAVAAIILAGTGTLVAFYDEPRVALVTPWLALALLAATASIAPVAHLHRDRRFITIGIADVVAEVSSATLSLVMLLSDRTDPVTALALRMPARSLVRWAITYVASGRTEFGRPVPGTDFAGVRVLLAFSTYQLAFSVVNFVARHLDQVLVGRALGAEALGIYERTYQLMRYPLLLMTFAMTPAIQPVVRTLSEAPAEATRLHLHLTRVLAYAGVAAGAAVVVGADLIVAVLLGDGWEHVVPILRVFGLAVPAQVVMSTSGSFFQSMGNTRLLFLSGVVSAAVMVTAMFVGLANRDLTELALALTVAFHLNFVQTYWVLHALVLKRSPAPFFRAMALPAAIVVALAVVVLRG